MLTAPNEAAVISYESLKDQQKQMSSPPPLLTDAIKAANSSNKFHVEPADVTYSLIQRRTSQGGRQL